MADASRADERRLQLLLSALFLTDDAVLERLIPRASVAWISEWLGLGPIEHFGPHALRHLVAVQLAPRAALAYDPTNPRPRWKLIDNYLRGRVELDDAERRRIARVVAAVL